MEDSTITILATIGSVVLSAIMIMAWITRFINKKFNEQHTNARRRAKENRLIFETMLLLIKVVRGDKVNGDLECMESRVQRYLFNLIQADGEDEDLD